MPSRWKPVGAASWVLGEIPDPTRVEAHCACAWHSQNRGGILHVGLTDLTEVPVQRTRHPRASRDIPG